MIILTEIKMITSIFEYRTDDNLLPILNQHKINLISL